MHEPTLGRRAFLTAAAATTGLAISRGFGVGGATEPSPPADFDSALRDFVASLGTGQRKQILLPFDHPSRQVTNAIAFLDRPHIGTLLSPSQLAAAADLTGRMVSEKGLHDLAGTFAVEGKFEGCVLAVYGDPAEGAAQATLMGGHVHVRGGDRGGVPLGGGVSYGHQIGNETWRVEGNSFAHHGDAANAVYAALDEGERSRAVAPSAPIELVVQPQDQSGRFAGIRIGKTNAAARSAADALISTVLSTYPDDDARLALEALDARGGVDALHLAFYESHGFHADMIPVADLDADERARQGTPYWQVWRLEGPGTVIHFQGYPHVHAYVQITGPNGEWHRGDALGRLDRTIEHAAMRDLLEDALRDATGGPLAFHSEQIPGRLCPGDVTTGLAWTLDPYGNLVAEIEIEGGAMAAPLRDRLAAQGRVVADTELVHVATSDYFARRKDLVGEPSEIQVGDQRVGEALAQHLRTSPLLAG